MSCLIQKQIREVPFNVTNAGKNMDITCTDALSSSGHRMMTFTNTVGSCQN